MPTKATESLVLEVGSLVVTPSRVPKDKRGFLIAAGTVGVILQRPQTAYPGQFQVQFVGHQPYWMHGREIAPYFGEKNV
jgi:hypothetical protein